MAIAFVKDSSAVVAGSGGPPGTAAVSFGSNITAGNSLLCFVAQAASGNRTYSVADNVGGTWVKAVGVTNQTIGGGALGVEIYYCASSPGGSVTITVTQSSSLIAFNAAAAEFSGFGGTITVDASDSKNENGVNSNNHDCSASGITSANPVLAVSSGCMSSTGTECNPGSGYTEVLNAFVGNRTLFQWQHFASGCTNEKAAWSNTGTARQGLSVMALLSGAGGGGVTIPVFMHHYRQLRG